ncbi:hypothetical protein B0H14DRAFT_2610615 [Mycena olivaceomarginata]|nr:hypothetical protein B0H14DRAFT_2610615 [Mycena olivaceomarginata]
MDSKKPLDSFSAFVRNMKAQKIQDWWAHKEMKECIIPRLVKSQSLVNLQPLIPADVWDSTPSTTNTRSQHHWTNSFTGMKLSLVEAIEKHVNVVGFTKYLCNPST